MAATASLMTELGRIAPEFTLPNVATGELVSLQQLPKKPATLVMFICRHCPYVLHVKPELARLNDDYSERVNLIGISSNDVERYPEDGPDKLAELAEELGFPVLYDESQDVAKAYQAACTPDFFLFDGQHRLVYRGQLDDSRPGNSKSLNGKDLRGALDSVLAGRQVDPDQKASVGCSIKWKRGNEPGSQ
jgi:peroxiredoxin